MRAFDVRSFDQRGRRILKTSFEKALFDRNKAVKRVGSPDGFARGTGLSGEWPGEVMMAVWHDAATKVAC
jgi:hypothetical protein